MINPRITDRDTEIVRYIEEYGFITIGQCYQIWLKDRRYGYDIARKRLNKIQEMGYLKSYKDINNIYSEKVWYIEDEYKNPSKHMILVMDVYAELVRLGADILYYKREQNWLEGKYRSDAFVIFRLDNYVYSSFVEVIKGTSTQSFAQTKKYFEKKYSEIHSNNDEVMNTIKNILSVNMNFNYPQLIIVDNIKHKNDMEIPNQNIISIDFKLSGLSKIFA